MKKEYLTFFYLTRIFKWQRPQFYDAYSYNDHILPNWPSPNKEQFVASLESFVIFHLYSSKNNAQSLSLRT